MMKLSVGFPALQEEISILEKYMDSDPLETLSAVVTPEELAEVRAEAGAVRVSPAILDYIVRVTTATRDSNDVLMGVSPRGTLALMHAAKAYACLNGRDYVVPDDVKAVAVPVLAHRIKLGIGIGNPEKVMAGLLAGIKVPTEDFTK
jgi:MoxR-like ATPase